MSNFTSFIIDDFIEARNYVCQPLEGYRTPVIITKFSTRRMTSIGVIEGDINEKSRLFIELLEKAIKDPSIDVMEEVDKIKERANVKYGVIKRGGHSIDPIDQLTCN
ncbi:hypothetical protein [Rurimicrobium arvi]|uniref:Uncharacterized protein n=1 Tax=Rurimicrobium arvi TaxID=2049916 RepID=A0ABP8N0N0_9BACT